MKPLLEVHDLRVDFAAGWGRRPALQALAGVSFALQRGQTYAIVGESGCGKTTLLRAIAGLLPGAKVAGNIHFSGRELAGLSRAAYRPLRKEIAVLFQDPAGSLSPRRTVKDLLSEPFIIHNARVNLPNEVARLLDMVGLSADFAARYPHELSGGQARRIGVARALALSPKLILADEPTAGLDVSVQGELLNLLNELRAAHGMAMLMITHNLHIIRHVAERMGIMYLGRLVEEGGTSEIFHSPRHPYTKCLLSANLSIAGAAGERIILRGEPPSIAARPSGCEFRQRCPFAEEPLCLDAPGWTADEGRGWRCWKGIEVN